MGCRSIAFTRDASRLPLTATLLLVGALGALGAPAAWAQSDIVLFKNGDRLTGEIKFLDRGKVSFDAAATGVIKLEWDDIDQFFSATTFELTLDNGERLYGRLLETDADGEVRVATGGGTRELQTQTIVRMTPIESKVVDRIEMNVDVGYSLAKANDLEQTNLGYDFRYRDEQRQVALSFDSSTSSSESDPSSTRVFTNAVYRRFLNNSTWDPFGIGQVERNDELGIDKRTAVGGGMSHWIRDRSSSRFAFSGGLIRSQEDDAGSTETKSDTEALVGVDLEWFRYDEPELDVTLNFALYQRLSGTKEPRGNLDVNFRWEIFKDFFWGFSVYYTFDQQTESEEPTTDYGSFTSLGWKF